MSVPALGVTVSSDVLPVGYPLRRGLHCAVNPPVWRTTKCYGGFRCWLLSKMTTNLGRCTLPVSKATSSAIADTSGGVVDAENT